MLDITTISIPSTSKTRRNGDDYKNFLLAYKEFTIKKRVFSPGSSVTVPSQFSERLAADIFEFDVDHSLRLDGLHPSTNDTYEVKGTGFSNNKVRFNPSNQADHVIWIKIRDGIVEIREIDVDIYNYLDKNGFVNIDSKMKQISIVTYTY